MYVSLRSRRSLQTKNQYNKSKKKTIQNRKQNGDVLLLTFCGRYASWILGTIMCSEFTSCNIGYSYDPGKKQECGGHHTQFTLCKLVLIRVHLSNILMMFLTESFFTPQPFQNLNLSLPSIDINQIPDARICKIKVSIRDR
jgi:hypothetical protein